MTPTALSVNGTGLITGKPVTATISPLPEESGVVFTVDGVDIPARPEYVVDTNRGVTLAHQGKVLSIVEHCLSACAMGDYRDLRISLSGAPELPLLDGSSEEWLSYLDTALPSPPPAKQLELSSPVLYTDPQNPGIQLIALPSDSLQLTYLVDFPHPDLQRRWFSWRESDGPLRQEIAPARTFGMMSELPVLQAQGLALGVTLENTLGLTDEGGYSSPLRMPDEPLRHKILDLIGDLMLCGIPIHALKAHIIVYWGGHKAHIAFGQKLASAITPQPLSN